ncbi:MAG: TetR/AcrR family transcriptional regulator [Bacteroidales bacterium]|nr:TetR/AcrR family transcriptional regulator [Bacteroidales bacterium]
MAKIDETRAKIIEIASKLFQKFGFEKTSMEDIAKSAHKAKGSIYYHFSSKEELFKTVVTEELDKLKATLMPVINDTTIIEPEKMAQYLYRRMEFLNTAFIYHQALKDEFIKNFDLTQECDMLKEARRNFDLWEREQLTTIMTSGKNNGHIANNIETSAFVDIVVMILKGLEVPFFIKGNYRYYAPTFESLLVNVVQALTFIK